jgi:hypothetical protein
LYGLYQFIAGRHEHEFAITKLSQYAVHGASPPFLEYEYFFWPDVTVRWITALCDEGTWLIQPAVGLKYKSFPNFINGKASIPARRDRDDDWQPARIDRNRRAVLHRPPVL